MKILIISGFLGAGKTTFIKAMAKATGRQFVIVENEFAEENVDSKVLSQDQALAEMEIVELSEGCICCSLNLDFSFSVMTIANTLNPDYLVVEPSGVAQPTNIIKSLAKIQYDKVSLLAPVTIIDYQNYLMQKRDFYNYFQDQLIAAGTLVLSKSEDLTPEDFDRVRAELDVPSDVAFPTCHYSHWPKEDWLALLEKDFTGDDIHKVGQRFIQRKIAREADRDLTSMTLERLTFTNPDQVYAFMEDLMLEKYGQVVRSKGFVRTKDDLIHVELVEKQFSLTGLSPEEEANLIASQDDMDLEDQDADFDISKLVIIGKGLDKKAIEAAVSDVAK